MNFLFLFVSTLLTITGFNTFPVHFRRRRAGPDGDSSDPVGSARLRPVFLGKPTGVKDIRRDVSSRQIRRQTSLEPELEAPEGHFESDIKDLPEELPEQIEDLDDQVVETDERHFGLPNSAIQEKIHRERKRKEKLRNQLVIHPDSDALKGKRNQFVADDPLPEMIAGGDMEANPFADKTSFSSIIQQLFLESIGLS